MGLEDDSVMSSSSGDSEAEPWEQICNEYASSLGIDLSEFADEVTLTAYVRYARQLDGKFTQTFLVPASRPIPDNAKWVSPAVYFLTGEEEDRLYEHKQSKEIQSACETAGRVAYAVLVESDALERGYEISTVADWLVTFAEGRLGLTRDEYSLYYSGNRSLHLHTAKFVPGEEGREWLKQQAEAFTQDTEADLDTGIYHPKGQFRLSGAEHDETDLYKVNITPLLDDDLTISRESVLPRATSSPDEKEWPFLDIQSIEETHIHYAAGDGNRGPLPDEYQSRVVEEYLNDTAGGDPTDPEKSRSPIESAFSPYAKVGGDNGRSVCLLEQTGEVIERDGAYYVEAYVREARGGDGAFQRYNYDGFVMLSRKDAEKWDFEEGDVVVIIGGRSRESRLLDLTENEIDADIVEGALIEYGRDWALDALEFSNYDVGEAGKNGPRKEGAEPSDAARIKREIDNGQREPEYMDILKVSCRLLKLDGWEGACEWIEQTLGDEFDPDETYENLTAIVECYFDDIDPPSKM